MKLLGWMHRKLRQNNGEQLKDFISGQGLLDDQHYYPKPNFGSKSYKQHHHDSFIRKSFTGSLESAKSNYEEDDYGEESAAAMSELFHGFLAIGTLGSEHGSTDVPATPTFAYSDDYIIRKETDHVTEDELKKLINDELEKVLAAESESSGRNSYVSTGRSSYGSTITLGGKSTEGQESGNVCPLQEYLLGAAVESEVPIIKAVTANNNKKEHRASLGELFQRTKMTDEIREERRLSDKDNSDKSVINLVKKKLKKKKMPHHATSKTSSMAAPGTADHSSSADQAKLQHKILHMFHKKVHPEYSVVKKGQQMDEVKKKSELSNNDHGFSDEDIMIYPRTNFSRKSIRRVKSQSANPPQYALDEAESDVNREFWIKTDADYLVLEL